jgi:putative CocE/NonD family hydrolase
MKMRLRACVLGLVTLAATTTVATASPYPVIGDPILKEGSSFEATSWGYKSKALTLPASGAWPTLLTMEGYDGATRPSPNVYLRMDDGELMALLVKFGQGPRGDYAMVQASTRGTECSGGSFNLYDRRHAWDAHHIIEWVAAQPWSNERVGMFGSSFPGQTAYWAAATQPPHLAAVSANLLHSDIYRDIFMPGGVQNYLFPTLWTYAAGPHRLPQKAFENQTLMNDEICAQAQATRYSAGDLPQAQNEPAWAALRSVDDDWYTSHAAITYAPAIKIPYYQQNNWQDEQVGPRSIVLFDHINPTPREITDRFGNRRTVVPKRFVNSNGDHGYGSFAGNDRWAWFDIWLLDRPDVKGLTDAQVVNHFETNGNGSVITATKSGDQWPFADTSWERSYLHDGESMSFDAPTGAEAADTYLSGAARQNWFQYAPANFGSDVQTARGLPDQLHYASAPLTENFTIAGPIMMDLYASLASTDADFYVSISDLLPDGRVSFLQRGLLKASHRAVDPIRSYYAADGETLVQPYRPHTNPQPVMPGAITKYQIEIFPLGYIFRPGHRILIQIHTPPILEKIWGYTPTHHQPAAVTVYHDAAHPSSIQWPVVETDAPVTVATTPCPLQGGFFCAPASALNP